METTISQNSGANLQCFRVFLTPLRFKALGFRVEGLRVWGFRALGFRVQGSGCRA